MRLVHFQTHAIHRKLDEYPEHIDGNLLEAISKRHIREAAETRLVYSVLRVPQGPWFSVIFHRKARRPPTAQANLRVLQKRRTDDAIRA